MHRCKLPSGAFLGEMVVGHKNSKVMNPHYERIMKTFVEIADTAGRSECENALYKVFVNMLFSFSETEVSSELREYLLESRNCRNFVF